MEKKGDLGVQHTALVALSPQAVLERGYSITRTPHDHKVVTHAAGITEGQALEVILYNGKLNVVVHSGETKL